MVKERAKATIRDLAKNLLIVWATASLTTLVMQVVLGSFDEGYLTDPDLWRLVFIPTGVGTTVGTIWRHVEKEDEERLDYPSILATKAEGKAPF